MDPAPPPRALLRAYLSSFVIEPLLPQLPQRKLVLHRRSLIIREQDLDFIPQDQQIASQKLYAVLGLIHMQSDSFLLIVTAAECVGSINGAEIYRINKVEAATLNPPHTCTHQQKWYIDMVKKILCKGFYFSHNYDLTSSRQKQYNQRIRMSAKLKTMHDLADSRYYWNLGMYEDFLSQNISSEWFTPLIQGFVHITSCEVLSQKLKYALISRRRWLHAGTRFNARGIKDSGDCANFVQTEFLLIKGSYLCSHVQIRGSVPLFWCQKGVTQSLSITRSPEITKKVFEKHFEQVKADYQKVLVLNLLAQHKSWEWKLTLALQDQFKDLELPYAKYKFYDFHGQCKGNKFHKVTSDLIEPIEDLLRDFGYFQESLDTEVAYSLQRGVCRTNCLDCLDRTNVVQTKVALSVLEEQLLKMKIKAKALYGMSLNTLTDKNMDISFIKAIMMAWADMGDILSDQYAGSGSTISQVTRTGKEGFIGKIQHGFTSINRFLANNFDDPYKQQGIDLILGNHPLNVPRGLRCEVEKQLLNFQSEFQIKTPLRVLVITWNMGGFSPADITADLYKLGVLDKQEIAKADIVIFALQQIVKLNASSVFSGKDPKRIQLWENVIHINLNANQNQNFALTKKFSRLQTKSMVGCFLTIFVSEEHQHRIRRIEASKVKQGFSGSAGNKGAVLIRFNFDDTSFCIINAHLASGKKQTKARLDQITDIFKQGFKRDVKYWNELNILDHDLILFLGDLNFRIEAIDNQVIRSKSAKGQLQILLKNDQLLANRDKHPILSLFNEGDIKFQPTYKYDRFSAVYDTSRKARKPAWCDRILWHQKSPIKLQKYMALKSNFSDHRPVCGVFQATLIKQDQKRKEEIRASLFESFRSQGKIFKIMQLPQDDQGPILSHLPSDQDLFLEHQQTLNESELRRDFDQSPHKDEVIEIRSFQPQTLSGNKNLIQLSGSSQQAVEEVKVKQHINGESSEEQKGQNLDNKFEQCSEGRIEGGVKQINPGLQIAQKHSFLFDATEQPEPAVALMGLNGNET